MIHGNVFRAVFEPSRLDLITSCLQQLFKEDDGDSWKICFGDFLSPSGFYRKSSFSQNGKIQSSCDQNQSKSCCSHDLKREEK